MKKASIFTCVKIALFIAVLGIVLLKVSDVLEYKLSGYYRAPVTEQDAPVDVLIIGSSHAKNAIMPYYLWKDYGISSYNFASSGEKIQLSYYTLKDVINAVKPKVVVLDAYLSPDGVEEGINMNYGMIHESIDYMNIAENKIELAKKLSINHDENALAFLSNIYAYHYRWKELSEEDFIDKHTLEKGAIFLAGGSKFENIPMFEGKVSEEVKDGSGYEYLNKIMDLCEENDAKFVLINIPYTTQNEKAVNKQFTFRECAEERGFNSIYYPEVKNEIAIDPFTDFKDKGHLNIIGAKKITDYLGNYLIKELGVADHREDVAFESFNEFEHEFEASRIEKAEKADDAYSYAMSFWNSGKYRIEIVTYDGQVMDEILDAYTLKNEIKVSKYDDLDEESKDYIKSKLVQDDFTEETLMVLVYDKNNEDIVTSHRYIYNSGGYKEKITE